MVREKAEFLVPIGEINKSWQKVKSVGKKSYEYKNISVWVSYKKIYIRRKSIKENYSLSNWLKKNEREGDEVRDGTRKKKQKRYTERFSGGYGVGTG